MRIDSDNKELVVMITHKRTFGNDADEGGDPPQCVLRIEQMLGDITNYGDADQDQEEFDSNDWFYQIKY